MLISIIVPVYNVASYLKQCIDSILSQDFKEYEVLLIDDGSTDESGKICDAYAKVHDHIKVIHSKNEGAGPARNKGIEIATGKYIMFIDPDDWMEPHLLVDMYNQMEKGKADLLIWSLQAKIYNSNNELLTTKPIIAPELKLTTKKQCEQEFINIAMWDDLLLGVPWNKLYRLSLINEYHIRFPKLRRRQDIIFNIDYYKHITSLVTSSTIYSNYRIIKTGYSNKVPQNYYEISLYVYNYFKETLESFGEYTHHTKGLLESYFVSDVMNVISLCMNPKWKWSLKRKYGYIKEIILQADVKSAAMHAELHQGGSKLGRLLRNLKLSCLKKQKPFRMLIICYMERCAKKVMG